MRKEAGNVKGKWYENKRVNMLNQSHQVYKILQQMWDKTIISTQSSPDSRINKHEQEILIGL